VQPKPVHRPVPALPERSTPPNLPPLRRREERQDSTDEEYVAPNAEPIQEPDTKVVIVVSLLHACIQGRCVFGNLCMVGLKFRRSGDGSALIGPRGQSLGKESVEWSPAISSFVVRLHNASI